MTEKVNLWILFLNKNNSKCDASDIFIKQIKIVLECETERHLSEYETTINVITVKYLAVI